MKFGTWSAQGDEVLPLFSLRSLLYFAPALLDTQHLDRPARLLPSCENAADFSHVVPLCHCELVGRVCCVRPGCLGGHPDM